MATWKKVLFDGDAGLNLANANLTADASRTYTLSSGGYLKFQPNGNATDLLSMSAASVDLGAAGYTGSIGLANENTSLYLVNGISIFTANSYHLLSSPYVEFKASTGDDATGDGAKIIMKRDTNNGVAADDMNVGVIKFEAKNSNNANHEYAEISVNATDVTLGSEEGEINFNLYSSGSSTEALSLKPTTQNDKARYGIELYGNPLRRYITPMALAFSYKDVIVQPSTTDTFDAYYSGSYSETFVAPKDGSIVALSYSFNRSSSSGTLNGFKVEILVNGVVEKSLNTGGNSPSTGLRQNKANYLIASQVPFTENQRITVRFEVTNSSTASALSLSELGATVFAQFTEPIG